MTCNLDQENTLMTMTIRVRQSVMAMTLLTPMVGPAAAQDVIPVTVSAELDHRTRYLFAGVPFSSGHVIRATINVGYGGWTFHGFTNYDIDLEQINEGDVWGDYYHQFTEQLGGFAGAALYNFRFGDDWEATPELYAGIVLTVPGTPTLYYARDFDLTTGDHTVFTLTHGLPLSTATSLQATGRIEYNNGYYREGSSFSYADLNVSLPVVAGPLTISPMVFFVAGLADDFESRVVGGVNAHITLR